MKKSVLIVIAIIYVVSIVAINFFGMKVSVYNQKINVTEILCLNKTNEDKNITVNEYTSIEGEKRKSITIVFDKAANKNTMQGTMLQLETRVFPDNATKKELSYTASDNENIEFFTDESGKQTGLILFYGPTRYFDVVIRATDNSNVSLTVKVKAAVKE